MAIEGNTGSTSDADGGQVQRLVRPLRQVAGAVRCTFEAEPENDREEDDDVQTYERLPDVPAAYRPTIRKLMEQGALRGYTDKDPDSLEDNILRVSEDFCRVMTVLDKLGVLG